MAKEVVRHSNHANVMGCTLFFAFETQLFRERDWSVRIPVCGAVDVWMELREEKGGAR